LLKKDDFLYQKGDLGGGFFFLIEGKIDLLVKNDG
jgi:hypothetical protein